MYSLWDSSTVSGKVGEEEQVSHSAKDLRKSQAYCPDGACRATMTKAPRFLNWHGLCWFSGMSGNVTEELQTQKSQKLKLLNKQDNRNSVCASPNPDFRSVSLCLIRARKMQELMNLKTSTNQNAVKFCFHLSKNRKKNCFLTQQAE